MFGKASDRTKRRTTEALRSAVDVEVLMHAAEVKLRSCGKSKIVKNTAVEAYLAPAVNRNTFQCVVVTQSLVYLYQVLLVGT